MIDIIVAQFQTFRHGAEEQELHWVVPLSVRRVRSDQSGPQVGLKQLEEITNQTDFNLETAIQDEKVMQDLDLESLLMGADHSLWVKAAPIESDYGSKGCVNLPSSIAVSRL